MSLSRSNESDFDEYEDSEGYTPRSGVDNEGIKVVQNQPHDEEIAISDEESMVGGEMHTTASTSGLAARPGSGRSATIPDSGEYMQGGSVAVKGQASRTNSAHNTSESGRTTDSEARRAASASRSGASLQPSQQTGMGIGAGPSGSHSDRSSDDEDDDDDDDTEGKDMPGVKMSDEVRDLFQYIGRYRPQTIEIETRLKPFIPEYIPAVGDIDEFIKVPRPDGKPDHLGLKVLDEGASVQSDPTVLNLQLRAVSKQSNLQPATVTSIDDADKNPRRITSWVASIHDLHKSKPPPSVHYTKNMPDIERLMQEWPPQMEELLATIQLPTAELDVDLPTFVSIICSVLDIPVYTNMVESLHALFTLYHEFKINPHFGGQAEWNDSYT